MISKFLVISVFSAGFAALPMLASAQTGATTTTTGVPQTTTGTSPDNMGTGRPMNMGTMNEGSFNPRNYRSTTDCLNAAARANVSLSACSTPAAAKGSRR
jgi:hypothetical protein